MITRALVSLVLLSATVTAAGMPAAGEESSPGNSSPAPRAVEVGDSPALGHETAPVTIVEFADFQCPYSAQSARTLSQLLRLYPTQVRWVFKHYPLRIHPGAPLAHEAALAAGEQGKFWEMRELLFRNQNQLARDNLMGYASELGLDLAAFRETLESHRLRARVVRDLAEGRRRLQVGVTPTYFINGKRVVGARPLPEFRQLIEEELRSLAPRAAPPD